MAPANFAEVVTATEPAGVGVGVDVLLNLLGEAASGRDVSSVVPEITRAVLGRAHVHPTIKKLTYDLCKSAHLSDADCEFIMVSVKVDLTSRNVELLLSIMRFLPRMPMHKLAQMHEIGDLDVLQPLLGHDNGGVRAAAVEALHQILLLPPVLQAATASAGAANAFQESWSNLSDMLLDEEPQAVGAAAAAVAELVSLGLASTAATPSGFLLQRVGSICAAKVAAALGPVLETCAFVPSQRQVSVAKLLLLLVQQLLQRPEPGSGTLPLQPGSDLMVPALSSLVPSACTFLHQRVGSVDLAVRVECCRSLLTIMSLVRARAATTVGDAAAGAVVLPEPWAVSAVSSLLELPARQLVEAGLPDVVLAIARNLDALPPSIRQQAVQQLLPVVSHVADVPCRMEVYALVWDAVLEQELQRGSAAAKTGELSLASLLSDSYVSSLLKGVHAAGAAQKPPSGSSRLGTVSTAGPPQLAAESANGAAGPLSGGNAVVAAGGPRAVAEGKEDGADGTAAGGKEKKGMLGWGLFKSGSKKDGKDGAAAAQAAATAAAKEQQQQQVQQQDKKPQQKPTVASAASAFGAAAAGAAATVASVVMPPAAPGANVSIPQGQGRVIPDLAPTSSDGLPKRVLGLTTHRHEVVVSLLEAGLRLAQECEVMELCLAAQSAAARDQEAAAAVVAAVSGGGSARGVRVARWLHIARTILNATQGCMWWEPVVTPAITTQLSSEADGHAAADFSTLPADCWLQLLQAACHAARAAVPLLKAQQQQEGQVLAQSQEAVLPSYPALPQQQQQLPLLPGTTAAAQLLMDVEQEGTELQVLLRQLLRGWGGLSRPVRMRVAWVVCHYMHLPAALDEGWELVLKAVTDAMSRSGSTLRLNELMASASLGTLFRSERQAWPRDKPFVFDVVAASALCERAEMELCSLVVGLACMQQLLALLHNHLAAAAAAVPAAAALPAAAAPDSQEDGETAALPAVPAAAAAAAAAVPDVKQVQADVLAIAARIEAVAREVQTPEVVASPHLKEWVGRIMRMCGAVLSYVPPKVADPAAGNDDSSDDEQTTTGANGSGHDKPSAPAAFAESDSSSSDGEPDPGVNLPVMMPPSMYGRPGGPPRPMGQQMGFPALMPSSSPRQHSGTAAAVNMMRASSTSSSARFRGSISQSQATAAPTVSTIVPAPPYLVHSCTGDCLWGYPFSGPRTSVLFSSKRSRRHRALLEHLQAARQQKLGQQQLPGGLAAAGQLLDGAGLRLDTPEFWQALPGEPQHWQELTGPADPLLLRGTIQVAARAAGAAAAAGSSDSSDSWDAVTVLLEVSSRVPVEVTGAKVLLGTTGPVLLERRGLSWLLPKLSAGDKAQRSFQLRVLGYAPADISCTLELYPSVPPGEAAPVHLVCQPLNISMMAMLRPAVQPPHRGAPPSAAEFFRQWSSLPARADLSGMCAWPGLEGQEIALSGILRQPLTCVLLQYLPAQSAYQAGFTGTTLAGEQLSVLTYMQLLPPAVAGSSTVSSQAACQVYVRSSSPEVVRAVQVHAAGWLRDLSGGTILASVVQTGSHATGRPKPPIDPRVSSLHSSFLAASSCAPGGATALGSGVGLGPKVGHPWVRGAALAEWQRLVSLA